MTSQKDQIQSLIADIEQVLGSTQPRTAWIRASDTERQRQTLAKAQDYLMSLQQAFDAPGGWGPVDPSTGQVAGLEEDTSSSATSPRASRGIAGIFSGLSAKRTSDPSDLSDPVDASERSAEDVLQALLTEMKFLRSSALEPLRLEMNSLREQRDRLRQEVKGLDAERSGLDGRPAVSEEQLNQFLAALMERLQERLSAQVTQTLGQLESDHAGAVARLSATTDAESLQLRPSNQGNQLEEMRQLQSRSDQLLVNIESTLQGMYETLQKNIDSYQYSLNEGIENMHSLGRQGEVIVRSLVDHLTQQLGQSAPPEPAFYPPRSAASIAPTMPIAPVAPPIAPTASTATETTDTVASLDDILPEDAVQEPEDCIQEDGTIDLDLLKLDIDRSDEDDELAADDLTVDSAIAAAQVTATESEDAEIEAKVTPTADAAYLADLTIDDLTVDTSDEPLAEMPSFGESSGDSGSDLGSDSALNFQPADETELADILPDFGEPAEESTEGFSEEPTEESTEEPIEEAPEEPIDRADDEAAAEPDSVFEDAVFEESMAAILAAAALGTTGTPEPEPEPELEPAIATATDIPESALVPDSPETTAIDIPESALVPDIPETEDEISRGLSALLNVPAVAEDEVRNDETSSDETSSDDEVLDHLAAELEANNQAADRIARESVLSGLDEPSLNLASDLEEATVFTADAPLPEVLTHDAHPLESSLIPDLPGAFTEEASAEETPTEEIEEASAEETPTEEAFIGEMSIEQMPTEETLAEEMPVEETEEASVKEAFTEETHTEEASAEEASAEETPTEETPTEETEEALAEEMPAEESMAIEPPFAADSTDPDSAPDRLEESLLDLEGGPQDVPLSDALADDPIDLLDQVADLPTDDLLDNPPVDFPLESLPESELEVTPSESVSEPPSEPVSEPLAAVEPPTESVIESPAPVAFDDDLDFYRDQDSLPDPVDEYLESLTNGSEEPDPKDGEGEDYKGPTDPQPSAWFLGIDIGTTGLSAVLINQLGDQVYPLGWKMPGDSQTDLFRLPAVLEVDAQTGAAGAVGVAALQQSDQLLRSIKPLLKVGIPHSTGEPMIQWSDRQRLPLLSLQVALTDLLRTLMGCQAIGMEPRALRWALDNLKGVIVGYPNNWPDTYSFNVREAVLAAGIVAEPAQVYFVEEVIAALLSALPDPKVATEDLDTQQPGLYNCNWEGGTVVISAGATLTEAAIADLPQELDQLIYRDFALRSFTYAGDSLDQDIVCQLLHMPAQARLEASTTGASETSAAGGWQSLGLDRLNLPHAGEADRAKRHRLRQRLNDSALGREAIAAARKIKLILQEEAQCEITLADQSWVVKRQDLETKVFLPYIQRVNRQVNGLLSQKGLSAQAVKQVVCTGGSASLGAIARWLRQKFPNATIIQDTYSGEYSNSCSRVAYGLANLCRYSHVLDTHRHQYNDYFLLLELLRVLPDQPLPAGGILHLLEQRGVNTQACQSHILALIEGHLPPGLIPTEGDRPMISAQSPDIGTYQMLSELPLFKKQGGQIYIADPQQGERLRSYLETLLATKAQTLQEPLTAELAAEVV